MKTRVVAAIIAVAAGIGTTTAFGFGVDMDNPRQLIHLGVGERVLINCAGQSLLTFQPSKEEPSAVVQCSDGGPGFTFLQPY